MGAVQQAGVIRLGEALAAVLADIARQRRTGMGKIIISENVTLDGVVQDPAGVEGFRHGGWVGRIGGRGRERRPGPRWRRR